MDKKRGFSLVEVLVSLLLLSTVALGVLQQQWQMNRLMNHALLYSTALNHLNNGSERVYAKQSLNPISKPFKLKSLPQGQSVSIEIVWESANPSCCRLQRQLLTP